VEGSAVPDALLLLYFIFLMILLTSRRVLVALPRRYRDAAVMLRQ
jgi:hypothetical protein